MRQILVVGTAEDGAQSGASPKAEKSSHDQQVYLLKSDNKSSSTLTGETMTSRCQTHHCWKSVMASRLFGSSHDRRSGSSRARSRSAVCLLRDVSACAAAGAMCRWGVTWIVNKSGERKKGRVRRDWTASSGVEHLSVCVGLSPFKVRSKEKWDPSRGKRRKSVCLWWPERVLRWQKKKKKKDHYPVADLAVWGP